MDTKTQQFIITINGIDDISKVDLNGADILNGESLVVSAIPTPDGVQLDDNEVMIEISNIEPGVKYKHLQIIVDGIDPITLQDIHELEGEALIKASEKHSKARTKRNAKNAKLEAKEKAKEEKLARQREILRAAEEQRKKEEAEIKRHLDELQAEEEAMAREAADLDYAEKNDFATEEIKLSIQIEEEMEILDRDGEEEFVILDESKLSHEELKDYKIRQERDIERKLTFGWLNELAEVKLRTKDNERILEEVELTFKPLTDAAEEAQDKINNVEIELGLAREVLGDANVVAHEARDAASLVGLATEDQNKLNGELDDANAIVASAKQRIAELEEKLADAKAEFERKNNELIGASSEADQYKKAISNSVKEELVIKDRVLTNLNKKANKANHSIKKAWKAEDELSTIEFIAKKHEGEVEKLEARSTELKDKVEHLEIALNRANEDESVLIASDLANEKTNLEHVEEELKNLFVVESKNLEDLAKSKEKADEASFIADLNTAIALVAQEAAKVVEGHIINDLEAMTEHRALTEREKLSLTQEIELLKDKLTQEITIKESTDRPRYVITDSMSKREKWVKFAHKEIYWTIYERGFNSRDAEFERSRKALDEEREGFLKDLQDKIEAADREIEAHREVAAAEVKAIKDASEKEAREARENAEKETRLAKEYAEKQAREIKEESDRELKIAKQNAAHELESIREKARVEKEEAEAEAARLKAETEEQIAIQKEELDAKLFAAERLIAEDKAKHDEKEAALQAMAEEANNSRDESEAKLENANEEIQRQAGVIEGNENQIESLNETNAELETKAQRLSIHLDTKIAENETLEAKLEKISAELKEKKDELKKQTKIATDAVTQADQAKTEARNKAKAMLAKLEAEIEEDIVALDE